MGPFLEELCNRPGEFESECLPVLKAIEDTGAHSWKNFVIGLGSLRVNDYLFLRLLKTQGPIPGRTL